MSLLCKCSYLHKDNTYLKISLDPLNKKHLKCMHCGRRVFIRTLTPTEYKKEMKKFS